MQHAARVYWALPMLPLIKRLARWAAALTLILAWMVIYPIGVVAVDAADTTPAAR